MPGGYHNQARMTINSSGGTLATLALGAAVTPFNTFANAGASDQEIVQYGIIDTSANVSEQGWGQYLATGSSIGAPAITRNPYTNGGVLVSLSTAAQVFITPSAADLMQLAIMAASNLGAL